MPVILRRVIVIVVLIIVTFFIYSLIDKPGATKLLAKIRGIELGGLSFSTGSGSLTSGNNEDFSEIISTGEVSQLSGELSGLSNEEIKDIDDDISKLFDAIANQTGQQVTGSVSSTGTQKTGSQTKPSSGSTPKPTSAGKLSEQDLKEVEKLLNNLVE